MARPLQAVLQHLRTAAAPGDSPGVADAQLLERFVAQGDEAAFELLLWRHSPMVLALCRRLLRDERDAQDAFQAALLALALRARSITRGESVAGWLYRVAYRAAVRLRARTARRQDREQPLDGLALASGEPGPAAAAALGELRQALDEQVSRLPAKFREAFVLRCLAGKSSAEAARELGCPVGTIESRLTRARARLRAGLARRGFGTSAGLLAFGFTGEAAFALGPRPLVVSTIRAATGVAAGRAAASGVVPAKVAALTQGVLRAMFWTKLKVGAGVVAALGALLTGLAGYAFQASGARAPAPGPAGPRAVAKEGPAKPKGGTPGPEERLRREVNKLTLKLEVAELNMLLLKETVRFLKKELDRRREEVDGVLTKVNVEKNTISLTLGRTRLRLEKVPISPEAKFFLGPRECSINDLKPGMRVSLKLVTDKDRSLVILIRGAPAKDKAPEENGPQHANR